MSDVFNILGAITNKSLMVALMSASERVEGWSSWQFQCSLEKFIWHEVLNMTKNVSLECSIVRAYGV